MRCELRFQVLLSPVAELQQRAKNDFVLRVAKPVALEDSYDFGHDGPGASRAQRKRSQTRSDATSEPLSSSVGYHHSWRAAARRWNVLVALSALQFVQRAQSVPRCWGRFRGRRHIRATLPLCARRPLRFPRERMRVTVGKDVFFASRNHFSAEAGWFQCKWISPKPSQASGAASSRTAASNCLLASSQRSCLYRNSP